MAYMPTNNIYLGAASALLAGVPDIAILKNDGGKLYNDIHNFRHWLSFLPPITLHILLDKFTHGNGKRWYAGKWYEYFYKWRERMWVEVITWAVNLAIITYYLITYKFFELWQTG